ncbi:Com family DNA-binding transcriptional regulator [Eikenella sp. NML03-A-027]|uniref:zinc finger domain-containing protein n=1 Tax=Eikenella sp. NML03-A-027 TaxID=1795828 RepID=UPI0009EEDD89|nr:Com family DNA-binding transcriptional regulator [Eikenella sp. NML03-A-027]
MQYRCKSCGKLLAVGSGTVQIKCQRCKTVNQFSFLTTQSTHECPTSARSQPHGKARQNTRQERV